jgi:predicted phage tail protein
MKTIKLFGDLQTFQPEWQLDVKTPGEAMRAIEANRPGFLQSADSGDYVAFLFDGQNPELIRQVTLDNASAPWGSEILIIIPRAGGDLPATAIVSAFGALGVTLAADGIAAIAITAIVNIGLSMAFSAIANLITGNKQAVNPVNTESYESKPSFISNGPVNVINAGHPYPIVAGDFLCGSIVLSSRIHVQDIPL